MNKKLMVNSISVQSFRGIGQERKLDLNKITVIHGENGTGKSSFADAFEYLFSGSLRSLKSRTINPEVIFHKKSSKEDFKIEAKFSSKSYLKRDSSNKLNSKGIIKEILDDPYIKNASFVLKRRNLLDFVEGTQNERYESISALCGFDDFSKVQSILSSSSSNLNDKLKEKEKELNKFTEKLSKVLIDDTSLDFKQCFEEINKLLKDTNNELINENSDFKKCSNEIIFSKNDILINDQLSNFNQLYDSLNLDLKEEFENLIKDYKTLAIESFKSSESLLNVLNVSKNYLTLDNIKECPICHSNIDSNEILNNIDKEIKYLRNNNSKLDDWKNNVKSFRDKLYSIKNNLNKLDESINKLSEYDEIEFPEDISFKNINLNIENLIKILNELLDLNYSSKIDTFDFSVLLKEYVDIKFHFDNYFKNFKVSDNLYKLNKIKQSLNILDNRKELESDIKILRKKAVTAEITFNVFKEKKEEFIRNLLLKIIDNIRYYYEYIHDEEYISKPNIKISNSNLVDVILNCYGEDVDARSYASEGHLDTLGLSIFLAFNKEFSKILLIVLDDVVSTVDFAHKDRVARLLIDKFEDYQFFITTHNKLWAEQIKRLVSATHNKVRVYEIIDWDLFEGPVLSKPLNPEEKIKKYLEGEDKDLFAAGNTARRYLEYNLKRICDLNNIKVPYKEKYDVGSLFVDTKDSCLNFVKDTDLEDYYRKIWVDIERTQDRGNLLSHDNIISMDLSNTDVKGFCEAVINLRKAYTCYCNKSSYLKFDSKNKRLVCNNCNSSENMNELGKFDLNVKNFGKNIIDSSDYVIGYLAKFNNGKTVNKRTAELMVPIIKDQLTSKNIDDLNKIIYVSRIIDKNELKSIFSEKLEDSLIEENEVIENLINSNNNIHKLNNESFFIL